MIGFYRAQPQAIRCSAFFLSRIENLIGTSVLKTGGHSLRIMRSNWSPLISSPCRRSVFQVLYVFLVLAHDRRRILNFNVTVPPNCRVDGTASARGLSLRSAFPVASPTLPASGHLARLARRGSTSGLLVIRQMTLTRSKVVGNLRQRAGTGGNRQKTSRVPVARAPSLFRSR